MKLFFRLAALLLTVVTLSACSRTKEEALADLEKLYNETSAQCSKFSTGDWDDYESELKDIEADIDKFEYTAQEKIQIGKLKVKCAALSLKGKAAKATEAAGDAAADAVKAAQDAAEEISKVAKDAAEDISDAAKDLKKSVE